MKLYHYTCVHASRLIGRRGTLRPNPHPLLWGTSLVWLTDMAEPDTEALGLTSRLCRCDRTAFRYQVLDLHCAGVMTWDRWKWLQGLDKADVNNLEGGGRQPERWWVSERPLKVRRG